ncbi:MAG TPA: hypothetical protein VMT46_11620 [Anaerolineaceae bacterium]|nr:hypothetical protein [Anaerolineaceae bacterium]
MQTSPWFSALFNPLNLLMLVVSIAAGLLAAWWLFPVGLVLWAIMVVSIAREPATVLNQTVQSRMALPQRFQTSFNRIEKSQINLFNTISGCEPGTRRALQPLRSQVDELVNQAYRLCQRMTPLENYCILTTQSTANSESQLNDLSYKIQSATDPLVKRESEEAYAALNDRLKKLKEASTILDRVEAQLISLANELEATLADVIRFQSLGSRTASQQAPQLVARIKSQIEQLHQFDAEATAV